MKTDTNSRQKEYISRIRQLYSDVEKWVRGKHFSVRQGEIEINEEVPGRYRVPTLTILDKKKKKIAELQPVGAWIIGAEGRVDIVGLLDRNSVIYMDPGGPYLSISTVVAGERVEEQSKPLFKSKE